MPVTQTAKRALRSSKRKEIINKLIMARVEVAIRKVHKDSSKINKSSAESLIDRASKKGLLHKNKAARMKSSLSKVSSKNKKAATPKSKTKKK